MYVVPVDNNSMNTALTFLFENNKKFLGEQCQASKIGEVAYREVVLKFLHFKKVRSHFCKVVAK